MADVLGCISAALSLVQFTNKTVNFFYQTIEGYRELDKKAERLKEDLETFEDIAISMYTLLSSRRAISESDTQLAKTLLRYQKTVSKLASTIEKIFNKSHSRHREYIDLLCKSKKLKELRQYLRDDTQAMIFQINIRTNKDIVVLQEEVQQLRHASSEASLYSLRARADQSIQRVQQDIHKEQQQSSLIGSAIGYVAGSLYNVTYKGLTGGLSYLFSLKTPKTFPAPAHLPSSLPLRPFRPGMPVDARQLYGFEPGPRGNINSECYAPEPTQNIQSTTIPPSQNSAPRYSSYSRPRIPPSQNSAPRYSSYSRPCIPPSQNSAQLPSSLPPGPFPPGRPSRDPWQNHHSRLRRYASIPPS